MQWEDAGKHCARGTGCGWLRAAVERDCSPDSRSSEELGAPEMGDASPHLFFSLARSCHTCAGRSPGKTHPASPLLWSPTPSRGVSAVPVPTLPPAPTSAMRAGDAYRCTLSWSLPRALSRKALLIFF